MLEIKVVIFVNYPQILIQLIKYFQKLTISTHTKVLKVLGGREENKRLFSKRKYICTMAIIKTQISSFIHPVNSQHLLSNIAWCQELKIEEGTRLNLCPQEFCSLVEKMRMLHVASMD